MGRIRNSVIKKKVFFIALSWAAFPAGHWPVMQVFVARMNLGLPVKINGEKTRISENWRVFSERGRFEDA